MSTLEISGISKSYGSSLALRDISLSIQEGELFFLLGPSGCGKTTLLRIIAGLSKPDLGSVVFRGENLLEKPAEARNLGMVFQQFSLWPHMTVAENVAYGLKLRGQKKEALERRVKEALNMVGLGNKGDRHPGALSGGEQQRAALARALVYKSDIILLDEPLSNLDAKLRKEMREEIRRIHKTLGITMVYVTHDQEEASALADRMALLKDGRVVQTGRPQEVFDCPKTVFAAHFFGEANVFKAAVGESQGNKVSLLCGERVLESRPGLHTTYRRGDKVVLVLRPHRFVFTDKTEGANLFSGKVVSQEFHGAFERYRVDCGDCMLTVMRIAGPDSELKRPGENVHAAVLPEAIHLIADRGEIEGTA